MKNENENEIKTCDKCDQGYVFIQKNGHDYAERCPCLLTLIEKSKYDNLLKNADVYKDKDMDFSAYKPRNSRQKTAHEGMYREHGSYYLYGPYGTGKTHLSTASVIQGVENGIMGIRISVPGLLQKMRDFQNGRTEIEERAWDIPYLVLDDIGKQKNSDWTEERLFELIDKRYDGFRSGNTNTTFTSQLPIKSLNTIKNMDGAIISRIGGMCRELFMDGEDYRLIKQEKEIE